MLEQSLQAQSSALVLGIDAGGSKTAALVADLQGNVLGRARGGAANYQAAGREAAITAMNEAVTAALHEAGAEIGQIQGLCLGAAGVDRPDDFAFWKGWAEETFPGAALYICNDAFLVLAAGTPDGWGLGMIAGTGSIAYGRDAQGKLARAGGWGYIMGDEGSNYGIGIAALHAVTRAVDGRGPQTRLVAAVLDHWGLDGPPGLVRKVYGSLPRAEITRLGKLVEEVAAAGDPVAQAILDDAGRELALAARAVVERMGLAGPVPCALAGAVLVFGQGVRPAFLRAAAEMGLSLDPVTLVPEPAQGAVRLALQALRSKK